MGFTSTTCRSFPENSFARLDLCANSVRANIANTSITHGIASGPETAFMPSSVSGVQIIANDVSEPIFVPSRNTTPIANDATIAIGCATMHTPKTVAMPFPPLNFIITG